MFPKRSHHPISPKVNDGRWVPHAYGVGDKQAGNAFVEKDDETEDRREAVSQGEAPPPPPIGEWEARVPKVAARPYSPTKREIE